MSTQLPDWRKLASAQTADDDSIERAFMDQAMNRVSQKARPIMKSPYWLGFETVFKNDDNTRMVGIFAFRIDKDLFYAPVFFLNGEIKGTDLFYRVAPKKFIPLTEEWMQFLLENHTNDLGHGVPRRYTSQLQQHLNMNRLRSPQMAPQGKYASADEQPDFKAAWEFLLKEGSEQKTIQPLLRDFILDTGGRSSVALIGDAMRKDAAFMNNLFELSHEDNFAPLELLNEVKSASHREEPVLVLHRREFDSTIKCASEDYFRRGYWLEDTRKEAALAAVFDDTVTQLQSINAPGVYDVVLKGGDSGKMFAARTSDVYSLGDSCSPFCGISISIGLPSRATEDPVYTLIDLKTGAMNRQCRGQIVGREETKVDGEQDFMKKTVSTGQAYVAFDPATTTVSPPFHVQSKTTSDGVTKIQALMQYRSTPVELVINPDYPKTNFETGVFGDNARFIEVAGNIDENDCYEGAGKDAPQPGTPEDVTYFLKGAGFKFASLHKDGLGDLTLDYGTHRTEAMSKVAMTCFIAKHLLVHGDAATQLVDKADAEGSTKFGYSVVEKSASSRPVMMQAEPTFDPEFDDRFNTQIAPQPKYTVGTDFFPEPVPNQRYGDAWDPAQEGSGDFLQTADSNQLAELARSGVSNIFEHGVVGELIRTYDSVSVIEKYIPKIEDGVDSLGRILFLLYWKPQDFQQAYGSDDLASKENEILSGFKSQGDLLLDLLKRNKPNRQGSVAPSS